MNDPDRITGMELLDAQAMRAIDRWAIEDRGIPSLELMEAAGRQVAEAALALRPEGPVLIACGGGNNGGDGLVAARHLFELGVPVELLVMSAPEKLSPDAEANFRRLPPAVKLSEQPEPEVVEAATTRAALILDALLGTGFSGSPREPIATTIRLLNQAAVPVIAVDIASGVDASSGEVADDPLNPGEGLAVQAQVTVSFHAAKLGHWLRPGKSHTGELQVTPIGIPAGEAVDSDSEPIRPAAHLLGPHLLGSLPRRSSRSTKFTSGQVVVAGGSRGLTGAVCLTAEAAARAGAGYVTAAVPADLESIFEIKLTEVMSRACPGPKGRLGPDSLPALTEALTAAAAAVIGSGAGREPDTQAVLREAVLGTAAPMVVDADGLNAFTGQVDLLAGRATAGSVTVLTPHAGELGRLLNEESDEIQARRLHHARRAAQKAGAVVVLKGDDTLITDGERVAINGLSAPALATAGTGDVLAGIIGGLCQLILQFGNCGFPGGVDFVGDDVEVVRRGQLR